MPYLDYTNEWLRELTRARRLERQLSVARPPTLRFGPTGDQVEFSILDAAPVGCGGRSTSAYKSWKSYQWRNGNRRCYYCDCDMTQQKGHPESVTLDHKNPLGLGGRDDPSNWCMCCWECNNLKGQLTEAEFRSLMARFNGGLSDVYVTEPCPLEQEDAQRDHHNHSYDRADWPRHGDVGGHQVPDRADDPENDDESDQVHVALTA